MIGQGRDTLLLPDGSFTEFSPIFQISSAEFP